MLDLENFKIKINEFLKMNKKIIGEILPRQLTKCVLKSAKIL